MQFEPEPEDEWQAHCRNVVAMVEGETAPEEPVMAGEVVPEAEAESEPVVAGEVVPEIVEGEEGATTEPVVASETMARDAPAEGAADEPRGWPSSLLEPRREGGVEVDVEAPRGVHTLRSWNYPQRRWRVADGDTVMIDEGPATTLRLVPGLYRPGDESGARDWNAKLFAERGAASMVSFALDDGTYLRSNLIGELRAHRPDESGRFRLDATFYAERDRFYPWSVSFHSVNHNGFYISHGSRFVLKTYYCCDEPDLRRETKKNASFALETPAASADESRGWFSWLLGPRRESGATADAEASKPKIKQAAGEAVASIEFLGRWNDNIDDLAMPVKFKAKYYGGDHFVRVVLGKLVDELVRNKAPSGILAINHRSYKECGSPRHEQLFSWSVSPDDLSFQRHGFADMKSRHKNIRFADFEGAIDTLGSDHKSAVYRVTLPSGGLDRSKWAGRPPPPAHDHERPPDEWLRRWHVVSRSWLRRRRRCLREEDRLAAVYRNKT